MTLEEIAKIKESSVEDIRQYMSSKGINLTDAPNAPLSPSMVKLIDPILYFNLRNRKANKKDAKTIHTQTDNTTIVTKELTQTTTETADYIAVTNNQPQRQGMKLSKAGHYFGQSWDSIADYLQEVGLPLEALAPKTRLSDVQYDKLKEHFGVAKNKKVGFDDVLIVDEDKRQYVGVVKFYDYWTNHFGYLSTNRLQGSVTSLRFNERDFIGTTPQEKDVVIFIPIYEGKPHATNVQVVKSDTPIEWRNILRYIGKYADIDSEVRLSNVIDKIIKITKGKGLIETLFAIIDQLEDECKNSFIQTYLSNQSILDYLYHCYTTSENLYSGDSAQQLFDSVFSKCDIDKCRTLLKSNSNLFHDDLISVDLGCKLFVETGDVKFISKLDEKCDNINNLAEELSKQSYQSQDNLLHSLWDFLSERNILKEFLETYLQKEFVRNHLVDYVLDNDDEISKSAIIQQTVCAYLEHENNVDKLASIFIKYPNIVTGCNISDELLCMLFVKTGDTEYLDKIATLSNVILPLANCLKTIDTDEQYQLLKLLDKDIANDIVLNHFEDSKIFEIWVEELWIAEKANVPYVVFDLETDGETIQQFAFTKDGSIQEYKSEELLSRLSRAIKKQPIVVGHKIKTWDLPILEKKGITTNAFIWDTIEIEALLNPCRYAYALHTSHIAQEDTELTDKLFWNQLYRLSMDAQLCNDLHDFLPREIDNILTSLQKPYFQKYFANDKSQQTQFFEDLLPLDSSLIKELKQINDISDDDETLIIAPRQLWNRLARYVSVCFPTENSSEYEIINQYIIPDLNISDFQKCFLQRYVQESATPIIGNIATYLRTPDNNKSNDTALINNEIIEECAITNNNRCICIDIDSFDREDIRNINFKHIYIVGSELQDRLHKCKIAEFTFADLIAKGSKLLLTMASVNYTPIDDNDCEQLGIVKTSLTANTWVEREGNTFVVYQNYEYHKFRKAFLDNFTTQPIIIEWKYNEEVRDKNRPFIVGTKRKKDFDSSIYRLMPSTSQRAKYWLYQLAIVKKLQQTNNGMPIVYIINDLQDYECLREYATSLGFYIPPYGSRFRKLEYIQQSKNGLIIVSKEQFVNEIGNYYTGDAALYIWDNLDLDRCQMMWNKLPFDTDIQDNEEKENQTGVTIKQCILAQWAVMELYHAQILANNSNSKFCIIDPLLLRKSMISLLSVMQIMKLYLYGLI